MTDRQILEPTAEHPITVEPASGTVRVRIGDRIIAESADALELREAGYPPVYYLPLEAADPSVLTASSHSSYCPYKGEASYYSIEADGTTLSDKVWYYAEPYEAVAPIAGHIAFYPDAVDIDVTETP